MSELASISTDVIASYVGSQTLTPSDALGVIPQVRDFFESYDRDHPDEFDKLERTADLFCAYVSKNRLNPSEIASFLNSIIESIP